MSAIYCSNINGELLTLRQEFQLIAQNAKRRRQTVQCNMDDTVELAIGMKVMMTCNVQTDIDLANGARSEIVDVMLHPDEPDHDAGAREVQLRYPPVYVLVRLQHTEVQLRGLDEGVVPIVPRTFSQSLTVDGEKHKVKRQQLPLTAAYAFTDYRAQGQTIRPVIVDLGKPATGSITPFNAYVACSRAAGRDWIRFLRDVDWAQFSSHPSEHLRREDDRLERLSERTKTQ